MKTIRTFNFFKLIIIIITSIFIISFQLTVNAEEDLTSSTASTPEEVNDEADQTEDEDTSKDMATRGTFTTPDEVKSFWITPGVDYALSSSDTEETIKKQITSIISKAEEYGFNTIFVPLESENGVIYASSSLKSATGFDVFDYILNAAKANDLYVYPVFNASYQMVEDAFISSDELSSEIRTAAAFNIEDFVELYDLDAVFINGYQNQATTNTMALYRSEGGGMGYDNWMNEGATALVTSMVDAVKAVRPETAVGIIVEPVWANEDTNTTGSKTTADYEMLTDGNIDIDSILSASPIDVIAVNAPGSLTDTAIPFEEVLTWWAEKSDEYDISAIALINNQNLGGELEGWAAPDQVMRQVIATREINNILGAVFYSYEGLVENHEQSTDVLIQYYSNMVQTADILTDLTVSRPEKQEYTTFESEAHFYGASDPNFAIQINGEDLERNENGVFSVAFPLKAGLNTFTFTHKEKDVIYNITREVQIFGDVSPSGSVTVEGGTELTFTAQAYVGTKVTATVNGTTIELTETEVESEEGSNDTSYTKFTGNYTVPSGDASASSLGNIVFTGVWDGITQTKQGATVNIASNIPIDTGNLVMVTADQARTYPTSVLNSDPWGNSFPLPKGTVDYVVSDLLTYQDESDTYNYYILKSGHRINADDVTTQGVQPGLVSTISTATFSADSSYAYLTLTPSVKMAFVSGLSPLNFNNESGLQGSFIANNFSILIESSTLAPEAIPLLTQNNLFSGITIAQEGEDVRVNLSLTTAGEFLGYIAYYDSAGNLVFRFTQYPNTITDLKVYIDPGHGGSDPGAIPIAGMKSEKDLNYEMAIKVADLLRARGVQVEMTEMLNVNPSLDERRDASIAYSPHIFISIHHNSSYSPAASGSEVWYFNPYSKSYAANISSAISGALNTTNRGAKYGWYRVASHTHFPAMLVEYGFLSNTAEYEKLRTAAYQDAMAQATVNSILASFGF